MSPNKILATRLGYTCGVCLKCHRVSDAVSTDHNLIRFDLFFSLCWQVNTVEHIYELPELSEPEMAEMVSQPHATRSDSFYFVDGALVMHNKADYSFLPSAPSAARQPPPPPPPHATADAAH